MSELKAVPHPGEILLSEITRIGMKQKELAIRTEVTDKHISTVINGSKDISASFARKLDIALGAPNGTWAKYQSDYDQYKIRYNEENDISDDEFKAFRDMKDIVDYFLTRGIMTNHCGDSEKIIQLREILCVNKLTLIPKITYNAAYRAQINKNTSVNAFVLFAWQRLCELETQEQIKNLTVPFDPVKLKIHLPDIIKLASEKRANVMLEGLQNIFAECGVAFKVVHHFKGAPVQGFIKSVDGGKVILCLTLRGKKADRFWFTLAHECGHLCNGDCDVRFVDFDSVKSDMEERADSFARDALIPETPYKKFVDEHRYNSESGIDSFAVSIGVPWWIVVGRLHNDGWLEWNTYSRAIPSYEWVNDT